MKKRQNKKITVLKRQMYVSFGLMFAIFTVIGSYVYFVNSTILAIAATHDAQDSIVEVQSKMTGLELSYLEKQSSLSDEYAYALGFVDGEETLYVKRDTITTASLYGQGIQE